MLTHVHPKLPMRNKNTTRDFYVTQLGFTEFGDGNYPHYLMVEKDAIQLHFFLYEQLNPKENDGQVYIRSNNIEEDYQYFQAKNIRLTPLETKPWGQTEFSILDPDNNLLTVGQAD